MELLASTHAAVWLLFCLGSLTGTKEGKLMVVPMDGSHWQSLKTVVERLAHNGHQIIVVNNQYIHERFQTLGTSLFNTSSYLDMAVTSFNNIMDTAHMINSILLHNKQLIQDLQEETFDAVLNDPAFYCGVIIAEYLRVPSIHFLRGLACEYEYISAQGYQIVIAKPERSIMQTGSKVLL
ncbi:hypothetical protein XELAEV_18044812mg [Xenopus laevis]|uniref:Uncharacterized protein n=1 Tax=Xenopus laevis TaxID=8355 RepID=A0A974BZH5_XENLA|nr:hypothetical protein XELAEV_18044812mg [Xenopus laevis]